MKRRFKWIFFSLAVLAAGAALAVGALKPVAVEVERAQRGELADFFSAAGVVAPNESLFVLAEAPGELLALNFKPGERVPEGAVLWRIDEDDYREEIERRIEILALQKAELSAQTRLGLAETAARTGQLERQLADAQYSHDRLFGGDKAVAQATMEAAATAYTIAARNYRDAMQANKASPPPYTDAQIYELRNLMDLARQNRILTEIDNTREAQEYYAGIIAAAKAQLEMLAPSKQELSSSAAAAAKQLDIAMEDLQSKLKAAPATAPFEGVVWQTAADAGEFISQNQPVMQLYRAEAMHIQAELGAGDAMRLFVGQKANCRLPDNTALKAAVSFVSPVAHETVSSLGISERRCLVKLELPGSPPLPEGVGAGFPVTLDFSVTAAQGVLSLPASAVVPVDAGSGVYLLKGSRAALTPVVTGLRIGGRVEIVSGIEEGEAVILNPHDYKIADKSRAAAIN
jgi:HlyD family secretion protein